MIDIQQAALGRFEEQPFAGPQGLVQQPRRIRDERPHLAGITKVLIAHDISVKCPCLCPLTPALLPRRGGEGWG